MTNARLLTGLVALVLAGCATASPAGSVSPSSSAEATSAPSASPMSSLSASESLIPSPSGSPGPVETIARSTSGGILPPDSIAIVMVENLRVREAPSLTAKILIALDTGARLEVSGNPSSLGPVVADGYDWYTVVYRGASASTEVIGWAAAGDAATPFLATLKPRCDRASDTTLTGYEHLACNGSESVTVEGTYGCGECGGFAPGTFQPAWLADPIGGIYMLHAKPGQGIGQIDMHIPPDSGIGIPVEGSILRVVGHFDDAAASTCFIAPLAGDTPAPADERATLLYCRERFVMDSWEKIGTDPSFPG